MDKKSRIKDKIRLRTYRFRCTGDPANEPPRLYSFLTRLAEGVNPNEAVDKVKTYTDEMKRMMHMGKRKYQGMQAIREHLVAVTPSRAYPGYTFGPGEVEKAVRSERITPQLPVSEVSVSILHTFFLFHALFHIISFLSKGIRCADHSSTRPK